MIYFALAEKLDVIKIGDSQHPCQRVRQLQQNYPDRLRRRATRPGGFGEEGRTHRRFRHLRLPGQREWFTAGSELLQFIEQECDPWEHDFTVALTIKTSEAVATALRVIANTRDVDVSVLANEILS